MRLLTLLAVTAIGCQPQDVYPPGTMRLKEKTVIFESSELACTLLEETNPSYIWGITLGHNPETRIHLSEGPIFHPEVLDVGTRVLPTGSYAGCEGVALYTVQSGPRKGHLYYIVPNSTKFE